MEFIPFEAGIEVSGAGILAIIDALGIQTVALQLLRSEGIGDGKGIDPKSWYSFDGYMRAYRKIAAQVGPLVLQGAGDAMLDRAQFHPQLKNLDDAMRSMDVAYHMNHRKNGNVMFDPATGKIEEGIGHYRYQRAPDANKIVMVCESPYPCSFDEGLIRAMARRFMAMVVVAHDDNKPCRQRGADSCTFEVTWIS